MRGSTVGISDGLHQPRNPLHTALLEFIDVIVSTVLIAPAVVSYWRGTWDLTQIYLIPHSQVMSALASFCIGLCGHLVFTLFQKYYRDTFHPDKHRLTYYYASRLYTYIFGAVCVNGWRGAWILTDIYMGTNFYVVLTITLIVVLILAFMRTLRNVSATPFALAPDYSDEYFDITTMFKTSGAREPGLFVLDCIFSVVVVGTLVVLAWRGIWAMVDLVLYPDNPYYSSWGSLILGYGIVTITFAIQPLVRWICDRVTGVWRIAAADIFLFFSFIGTVNVWRGIWHLQDLYFLTDNRILSLWLSHAIGFILLALLNCSNSVLVRGVYIDAEEPAGQCVVFPIYYIRLFFQRERRRKQKQLIDSMEKQEQNNTMFLLDKSSSAAQNNIKIVKSNANSHNKPSSETKPMISRTNEKPRNGEHPVLKDKESF